MLKAFFAICILVYSMSISAQTITVISSGKPGGTFAQRSDFYTTGLKNLGYNVLQTKNLTHSVARKRFLEEKNPVIMVWIDSISPLVKIDINESNFVAIEYTSNMYLCTIDENKSNGTLGYAKIYPLKPVESYNFKKYIPYKNSGDVVNAAVAKEVEAVYINKAGATKLESIGKKCQTIPDISQTAFVLARNIDIKNIREDVLKIINDQSFQQWHIQNGLNRFASTDYSIELNVAQQKLQNWRGKSE